MRHLRKHSPDTAQGRLDVALAPGRSDIRAGARLSVLSALMWLPMSAAVAVGLGGLVAGTMDPAGIAAAAVAFVCAGVLRAVLAMRATARLDQAADKILAAERAALVMGQDRLSPRAPREASAAVAAMLTEKLPLLVPYVRRYRAAYYRAALVPAILLLCAATFSWAVAAILLVAGPLIPVFMALVGLAARQASERQMAEIGTLSGLLADRLGALVDLRLLDARERMLSDFETRADRLRDRTMAVLRVAFLSSTVLEFFAAVGVAMVAVYVGFTLLGEIGFGAWGDGLTPGQGIFLLMLAPEFFQPLRDLAAAWHDKAGAVAVAGELASVEGEADGGAILGQGAAVPPLAQAVPTIALTGLRLGDLRFPDLHIAPGESLALTGASGSGKSTLIALIGGLVAPDAGTVTLDGVPLDAAQADAWRALVAWVPQSTHFADGTLRDGLRLGAPTGVTESDIAAALDLAQAGDVVAALPEGLDTVLGETGGGVSGGEARRLLVARAALSRRPVVLADEPTADLDPATAQAVIAALQALNRAGATVIVATHDRALAAAMGRRVSLDGAARVAAA
jgi:ATP-binding cassette subfamily C protein CydD